ncbi:MAG TPA: tetratricopeptide repeat-containing glycosyltransferase family protein, partial [Tepidisphaeraceae bacterium]
MDEQTLQSAMELHRRGKLDEAESLYRQILGREPKNSDALHLLGLVQIQRGQLAAGIGLIYQAIDLAPNIAGYYSNLGPALMDAGRIDEAVTCYQRLVGLEPTNASAFDRLARLMLHLRKTDEAISAAAEAVRLRPDVADYHAHLGSGYSLSGRYSLAVQPYTEALKLDPKNVNHLHDLAVAISETGRREEAIVLFDQAIKINPNFAWIHSSKGVVLSRLGRVAEAMDCFRQSIRIDPKSPAAYNNLGSLLQEQGKWAEALEQYRKAVSVEPNRPTSRWNLCRVLLLLGYFKEGWAEFDARLEMPQLRLKRAFPEPQWDGSDPAGKTILLHAEGGHGDAIHFIRLAPQVAERGARLILECQPALAPLFAELRGFDAIIARGQPLPSFDWQIPLQSLPHVLGITLENIPSRVPYLTAPAERVQKWKQRVAAESTENKVRVGLVWSGSRYANADNRTRTIDVFSPLGKVPGFKFFGLQTGPDANQSPPAGMDFADFSADLTDFAETAALVQNLDLVVTIDTSVAHLAGALGKPVW